MPHGCGCEHEIVEHADAANALAFVSASHGTVKFSVSTTDATLLTFNTTKFGRALCKAFD